MTRMTKPAAMPEGIRRTGVLSVLLIVFCCAGGAAWVGTALAADEEAPDLTMSFTTGDTMVLGDVGLIAGITWMGPDTLVVLEDIPDSVSESGDREVRLVFRDTEGTILHMEDFSGVLDRALAWDGEFLYSCGDAADGSSILYQIQVDTLQVEEAFDTPGHRPSAMCFDGRYVWITDRDAGRVDRFDPETKVTEGRTPGVELTLLVRRALAGQPAGNHQGGMFLGDQEIHLGTGVSVPDGGQQGNMEEKIAQISAIDAQDPRSVGQRPGHGE